MWKRHINCKKCPGCQAQCSQTEGVRLSNRPSWISHPSPQQAQVGPFMHASYFTRCLSCQANACLAWTLAKWFCVQICLLGQKYAWSTSLVSPSHRQLPFCAKMIHVYSSRPICVGAMLTTWIQKLANTLIHKYSLICAWFTQEKLLFCLLDLRKIVIFHPAVGPFHLKQSSSVKTQQQESLRQWQNKYCVLLIFDWLLNETKWNSKL